MEGKGPNGAQLTVERVVATGRWVTLAPGTWELTCRAKGYWPYRKALLVQGREHLSCLMVPEAVLAGTLPPAQASSPPAGAAPLGFPAGGGGELPLPPAGGALYLPGPGGPP